MPEQNNIHYKSENLAEFYRTNRVAWDDFYPSEKKVIERLCLGPEISVLDMGCGCGGLGAALKERFGITDYTGVEINEACANAAVSICPTGKFYCGDFLKLDKMISRDYDLAFSLSCADWQVETNALFSNLFDHVRPNGHMIFSCRLTNHVEVVKVIEARQRIQFDNSDAENTESAPYKVFKLNSIMKMFLSLGPIDKIYGYGYWGKCPATVAGLPFEDIYYIVFSLQKGSKKRTPRITLDVDTDFLLPN